MSHTEMLQVIDPENGEPTGEHVSRKELFEKKMWCRTTNVFVLNSAGQILCHQRSDNKERFPGAWFTHFGGHVTQGESFKISALKEANEEIGIKINSFQLIPWRTSKKEDSRIWVRDFLTVYDGDISLMAIPKDEIKQVKWFSPQEINEILDVEGNDAAVTGQWIAGTHDFECDYQCMRAVITAAIDMGIFGGDFKPMHKWQPPYNL